MTTTHHILMHMEFHVRWEFIRQMGALEVKNDNLMLVFVSFDSNLIYELCVNCSPYQEGKTTPK